MHTLPTELQAAIVDEAKSWLGTPYHPGGRVKGAGCDCATFIAEVCIALGLIPNIDIPNVAAVHYVETGNPLYLETVLKYCIEIPEEILQPGDLVMYKNAGYPIFTHGCIVVDWPQHVIHALQRRGVRSDNGAESYFRRWERKAFRIKEEQYNGLPLGPSEQNTGS